MFYCIMEVKNNLHYPLRDKEGAIIRFDNENDADIDRIYLQPEYDNLLKVIGIK